MLRNIEFPAVARDLRGQRWESTAWWPVRWPRHDASGESWIERLVCSLYAVLRMRLGICDRPWLCRAAITRRLRQGIEPVHANRIPAVAQILVVV